MSEIKVLPFFSGERSAGLRQAALAAIVAVGFSGCSEVEHYQTQTESPNPYLTPDTRQPIPLSESAVQEHRAVMLQHLETIQGIVNALVEEDYELAKGLTESHAGFFMHRRPFSPAHPQARQGARGPGAHQQPEQFPPAYHDYAMAHHEAVEQLARMIPSKDLKQILPPFNTVLKACVACHLEFKVRDAS
jgi:hypothetical protein